MRIGMMEKLGLGCLLAAGMASAHLGSDGFKPGAGETLNIGDSYTITFKVTVPHDNTDIALSTDGGNTFTNIKTDIVADRAEVKEFKWTVTGPKSSTAKIRFCQKSPNACTNADKTSNPGSGAGGHYVLITPAFTIAENSTALLGSAAVEPFSIDYHPSTRNVDVSFGLTESRDVTLKAFDTQGRLVATLVQGRYEAGSHSLSAFSNQIDATAQSLVFKLTLGDQVRSHLWMGL